MEILVIDNRPGILESLAGLLTSLACSARLAADPEAARRVLETSGAPMVIVRADLPGWERETLVRWLRTTGLSETRFILFLVTDEQERASELLRSGADDFLSEPLDVDELRARLWVAERILRLESDLRRVSNRLDRQVMVDELTGLMNQNALYRFSAPEMARTLRNAQPLSLMMIDLDGFTEMNQRYGQSFGDRALAHVAAVLRNSVRPYDQIGRWSDDAFLVILPDTALDQAMQVAGRVLMAVRLQPVQAEHDELVFINTSIGIHTWHPGRGRVLDFDRMVRESEKAMLRSRQEGGNRVQGSVSGARPKVASGT